MPALGLFSMTTGPCSHPEGAARVARAAEAAGFDSLWGGEHVVLPDPQTPPSPGRSGPPSSSWNSNVEKPRCSARM